MSDILSSNEQDQWARLIAHAWKNPVTLAKLRQDPKAEIERLKQLPTTDPDYPGDISDLGSNGYFTLPGLPEGLEQLNKQDIEKFLAENPGIFGIMQFCCV
ncbi:hypothetical protein [Chamaesiphon sp.]|uniref:hypothetical protein n=1 Tax=Chamaesiphon sp. TaxID=2814140 RepID=UPI0035940676